MLIKAIEIIIVLFFGYAAMIQIVKYSDSVRKKTTAEAITIVNGYIKKFFRFLQEIYEFFAKNNVQEEEIYPVYIGYSENGFDANILQKAFATLLSDFATAYYYNTDDRNANVIRYGFKAIDFKININDKWQKINYLKNIAEADLLNYIHASFPFFPSLPNLVSITLTDDILIVNVAKNKIGQQINYDYMDKMRQNLFNNMSKLAENIVLGYDKKILDTTAQTIYIEYPFKTHMHLLLTGDSGTGKSYALLFILGNLVKNCPDTNIYFCDYKNSDDFRFLQDLPHYYTGDDCFVGLQEYYAAFQTAKINGGDTKKNVLIFDEYPAFIGRRKQLDRLNKTKTGDEILSYVSEILMLGRSLNYAVWIICQRPDADVFKGCRDNFMTKCVLGNISKEHKAMIGGYPDIDTVFKVGEGVLLADGQSPALVKFPAIDNIDAWKQAILDHLNT